MFGKILIKSKIKIVTGMHIGGSNNFSAIGSVDSVVIKDAMTKLPIIPGSSLKGKLRTLLARSEQKSIKLKDINEDSEGVKRLFGTSSKPIMKSRLQFSDAFMSNSESFKNVGGPTEVKFENGINRLTSVANPRQIERVARGAEFDLAIVYDIEEEAEIKPDFENLSKAIGLLHMDYLGGHGTRGYGRVKLGDFSVQVVDGSLGEGVEDELCEILRGAEKYELLSI